MRSVLVILALALAGCAPPPSGGSALDRPGNVSADGRPIWHRCATIAGAVTSLCGGPAPAGYAEER